MPPGEKKDDSSPPVAQFSSDHFPSHSLRLSKPTGVYSSRSSDRLLLEQEEGRNEVQGFLNQSCLSPERDAEETVGVKEQATPVSPPEDQFSSGDNLSDVDGSSPEVGTPESEPSPKRELEELQDQERKESGDSRQQMNLLNPMTTILTVPELLEFASEEIPSSQIFQCMIIRDKRGFDRSLYPTYFMYLQMIIECGESHDNSIIESPHREGEEQDARDKVMKHLPSGVTTTSSGSGTSGSGGLGTSRPSRQVFLLVGRKRKRSKTYLIGLDPFEISRINCVAKLKSNVIGTQFRAVRYAFAGI